MNAFEVSKTLSINESDTISSVGWKAIQPVRYEEGSLWLDLIPLAKMAGYPKPSGAIVATAARLLRHYNFKDGECYPGGSLLSHGACLSARAVWKAIDWLIVTGLIKKTVRKDGSNIESNVYRLVFPDWCVQFDGKKGRWKVDITGIKPDLLRRIGHSTPTHIVPYPMHYVHGPENIVHDPMHHVPRNCETNYEAKSEGNNELSKEKSHKLSPAGSLSSQAGPEISGPEEVSGESSGLEGEEQPAGSTLGAAAPHPASVCLPPSPPETPAGPAGVIDQEAAPQAEQSAASLAPLYTDCHVQIIADAIKAWTKGDLTKPLVTRPGDNWRPAECQKIITLLNEQYQFGVEPSEANAEAIKPFVTRAQKLLLDGRSRY